MEWALWSPLVLAAVLLAAGSAATLLLPEPTGQPLGDAVADAGLLARPMGRPRRGSSSGEGGDNESGGQGAGVGGAVELGTSGEYGGSSRGGGLGEMARLLDPQQPGSSRQ